MTTLPSCILACSVFAGIALVLQGCGGGGSPTPAPPPGPPGPGPTPPPAGPCEAVPNCNTCKDGKTCTKCNDGFQPVGTPTQCMYACTSDLTLPTTSPEKKGLCLDDTTHHWCPSMVHSQWPNTKNEPVKTIRINKAWESDWTNMAKEKAWDSIAAYLHATGAKALVGTALTCDAASDAQDWKDVKALLQKIGAANVMGVAVGNELELLQYKCAPGDACEGIKGTFPTLAACCVNMWNVGGYLETSMINHIGDLDALGPEWKAVKVTSVFGAAILYHGTTFSDTQVARVNTFFKNILPKFGNRYAFSLNVYPYFDIGNHFDDPTKHSGSCKVSIDRSVCFDKPTCLIHQVLGNALSKRIAFDNENPGLSTQMQKLDFWLTETGWSAPLAMSLPAQNKDMSLCPEYSSYASMETYYKNFLAWDMVVPGLNKAIDLAFWFTMRDTTNFGQQEHFGLGGSGDVQKLCQNTTCKLQLHYESGHSETSIV